MSKAPARAKPKQSNTNKKQNSESKPTTLLEIVPGKFNENDWNNMLEVEDSQEFVWEIIDEIFDKTLNIIHKNYLDYQTVPYTINEARKAMLHILDWQFLSKDKDDDLTEVWIEDNEPEACVIDSWAQGFVDLEHKREPTPVESLHEIPQKEEDSKPNFLEELNRMLGKPSSPRLKSAKKEKTPDPENEKAKKIEEHKLKKKKLDAISRRVLEAPAETEVKKTIPREKNFISEIKKMEEPISKAPVACQSILKTLLSRPLTMREIEIDSDGNVQSIAKLDFDKAPMSNVKARFSVLSETKTTINSNQTKKKTKSSYNSSIFIEEEKILSEKIFPLRSHKFLPPKIKKKSQFTEEESDYVLDPAPGVVFTVFNTTRTGPKRPAASNKQSLVLEKSEHNLRPVKQIDQDSVTRSSIDEILNNSNNSIKAPLKLKPIPPISPSTAVN